MWSILDQLFQPLTCCRLCGARHGSPLCQPCRTELPILATACPQCAQPLEGTAARLCGQCLAHPPGFDVARAPFLYAPPVDRLIAGLKFHERLSDGRLLGSLLAEAIDSAPSVDLLLPIPLHRQRLRERGFNQAAELARMVSWKTGIPVDYDALARVRAGSPQHQARRRERIRQMRGAFEWQGREEPPARVALIDDVVTTGATADAAARCLKRAGAESVEIWAVARTPLRI